MRFPRAAIIFLITAFAFFVMWAATSRLISEISDGVDPFDDSLGGTYDDEKALLPTAFGIISAIFFVMTVIAFIIDSLGEEYEYYPTRRDNE